MIIYSTGIISSRDYLKAGWKLFLISNIILIVVFLFLLALIDMKILIAVSSKEYSKSTLNMGMQVAKAFNASTTILDVGEKINDFGLKDVSLLRERMESWNIDRPGIDVLEWAFKYLSKNNFIELSSVEAGFSKNTIVETKTGRLRVFLKGTFCDNVKLI